MMRQIELWGGAECTVNRVGDTFADQLRLTGHHNRIGDLDLIAELGVKALRLPVLWERVAPDRPEINDWNWSDEWLERLQTLNVRPIVGLIHHGSGPRYTSLVDESFAPLLAGHARATAQRYPWVMDWTPVNEPVTTARFSALYGHWYPHAQSERTFWLALLNQVEGVRQAMLAVREINPAARLVQTDDLGRTYATSALAEQAAFDNVRRWMTWDLLCGRVTRGHDLWQRLVAMGFEERLAVLADNPCPPQVIGINHYLTSDRFLDHRLQRYPAEVRGGNKVRSFADVEGVRVLDPPPPGLAGALAEAWDRYGIPLAITEVHNGCTREEQVRWTQEAWQIARKAQMAGIDVRAVTSWALFGSCNWNTLLTAPGIYEPGAFDVRGPEPRPTALAAVLKKLAIGEASIDSRPGWWRRPNRAAHPLVSRAAPVVEHIPGSGLTSPEAPILIVGATGTLGRALTAACDHRNLSVRSASRQDIDLTDPTSIAARLDEIGPSAVINAAGWVRVDAAEDSAEDCLLVNSEGAILLARECAVRSIPTVNFSSDLVFDGSQGTAYVESDLPNPRGVYGRSKAEMEAGILALPGRHLIVRTAAFFSPFDQANFAVHALRSWRSGQPFAAAADQRISPTYVPDLCNAALDLLLDGENGIWHLSNGEMLSWAEFAGALAKATGYDPHLIEAVPGTSIGWIAPRPASSGLVSERGGSLPSLASAIERFARHAPRIVAN